MPEQNPVIGNQSSNTMKYVLQLCVALLIAVTIFLAYRLNLSSKKLAQVEQLALNDHQQLAKFSEILGQTLESQDPNNNPSPLEVKISVEIFQKITQLIRQVEVLSLTPINPNAGTKQTTNTPSLEKKPPANAEMRWWYKVGNFVFQPIKDYFTNLVRVQVLDAPVNELAMTNNSQKLIKEEVLLRIFSARGLVINSLLPETITELTQVKKIVESNFSAQDKDTQVFLEDLKIVLNDLEELTKKRSSKPVTGDK
jgi:hypothetical protein